MEPEALNERPVPEEVPAAAEAAAAEAPVLINRYRFDEDTLRRSYKQLMRTTVLVQLGFALLLLIFAVNYTVRYFELFSQSTALLLMVLLLYVLAGLEAWRALRSVGRAVTKTLRRMEETKNVREYDVTLRFEETEIVTESSISGEPQHLPYSNFKKLTRGRDLIQIKTRATLVYTLDPARFENGTEADFWKLMMEKCPLAVPKSLRAKYV